MMLVVVLLCPFTMPVEECRAAPEAKFTIATVSDAQLCLLASQVFLDGFPTEFKHTHYAIVRCIDVKKPGQSA